MKFLNAIQIGAIDLAALGQFVGAAVGDLAEQEFFDPVKGIGFDDAQLIVEVESETLEFVVDDLLGAFVALNAFAGEDLHINDGAL